MYYRFTYDYIYRSCRLKEKKKLCLQLHMIIIILNAQSSKKFINSREKQNSTNHKPVLLFTSNITFCLNSKYIYTEREYNKSPSISWSENFYSKFYSKLLKLKKGRQQSSRMPVSRQQAIQAKPYSDLARCELKGPLIAPL